MQTLENLPTAYDILAESAEAIDWQIAESVQRAADELWGNLNLAEKLQGQFHTTDATNILREELELAILARLKEYVNQHV